MAAHQRVALVENVVEIVTALLLAHGALVDAVDGQGRTPLHHFATRGNGSAVAAAKLLLEAGAAVNTTDANGDTPLHTWASYSANIEFGKLLIAHYADTRALNNAGKRPRELVWSGRAKRSLLLAAEEKQRDNQHYYKRVRLEDMQPPAATPAATAEATAAGAEPEEEDEEESEDADGDEED